MHYGPSPEVLEQILNSYVDKRAYHYVRTSVADKFDKQCLDLATLMIRKRDLENDKEYLALAEAYWNSRGMKYNLQNDQL